MSEADTRDRHLWSEAKRISGLTPRAWSWLPESARLAWRREAERLAA